MAHDDSPSGQDTTPFREAALRVEAGADALSEAAALVAAMTLDEQLGCLDGDTPFWPGIADMGGTGYREKAWPAARVERLGVPGVWFADGPRGCVVGEATAFPVPMARGATFDPDLEEQVGEAIGAELAARGATITGAVCCNLLRHPAWGRAQETFGEDPHHVGEMAAALTRGLQHHVLASVKHFALNSMENARFTVDVTVDERALHEVYLPHFRRATAEGSGSVMSAYNSVNGSWCGEHHELLTSILRDEWGWDGIVISDFVFGLRDPVDSVRAGLDIEMPFRQQRAVTLTDAVVSGELDVEHVTRRATEVVATLLRFWPILSRRADPARVLCPEHRRLARTVASRSMVLLRNDGELLPVDPATLRTVAVVGRLAAVANLGDGGSSDVHPPEVVTPLVGLRAALPQVTISHHDTDESIAAGADLAIVVVGLTKDDEGEYLEGIGTAELMALFPPADDPRVGMDAPMPEIVRHPSPAPEDERMAPGGDRRTLRLHHDDEALIARVASINPRTVVVVMSGSAITMPWIDLAPVTLMCWYPGMEGGHGLADVITGAAEPGGRLPFAVPIDEADLVEFDPDATTATYGLLHGQWHLDAAGTAAAFPFGFGLGYTTVELVGAELDRDEARVVASVRNTGTRAGSTVVQVYGGHDTSTVVRPHRRLVGFARVEVPPGQVANVDVALDLDQLRIRSEGSWLVESGGHQLDVGLHAGDPHRVELEADLALDGDRVVIGRVRSAESRR